MPAAYSVIFALSTLSTLLPFACSIVLYKYFTGHRDRILLLLFFTLAVVAEILLNTLSYFGIKSTWLGPVYTILEFALVAGLLSYWQGKPSMQRLLRWSIPVFIGLYALVNVSDLERFAGDKINFISRPLALLILDAFVLYTLYALWQERPGQLASDFRFWILLAKAIYYSGSITQFAFMFTSNMGLMITLMKIHAVVNILGNILLTIGVLRIPKQVPEPALATRRPG